MCEGGWESLGMIDHGVSDCGCDCGWVWGGWESLGVSDHGV